MGLKITISLLLVLLFSTSCKKEISENDIYYPNIEIYLEEDIVEINIDSLERKAKEVFNNVCDVVFQNKTPLIKIEYGSFNKYILPHCIDDGFISIRNNLRITTNSIISDSTYHLSKLKEILKRHLLNQGKNPKLSDSPDKAIVSILIDSTESVANLKARLIDVTQAFDEIVNETLENIELNIFLDIPIPPPPFLEIPQGTFKYKLYFAEYGGRMDNSTCDVEIKGNRIRVLQDGSTNLTGGKVIFDGLIIKHKSGVWILAEDESDKDAEEVGGCTEFSIIYFDKKLIERC